ncbi:MAG: aminomethyl-transferring glycine dehydrogenase subunit GcvPA [Thermoguttaceae bacterium]|nr:aminomethyl-transferring glycine dehydrogenase subunit GcvPA [Thermoguttaceae bacterium]
MVFINNTEAQIREMLSAIGLKSIEDLFSEIPRECRVEGDLGLPHPLSELELDRHMQRLAGLNRSAQEVSCFLGGGCYDHFIPAVVDALASRPEFVTAYTPYQPEASQGTLQAMFEYQTLLARLAAMDVSNASMYDGASAAAEAVLMSVEITGRQKVVLAGTIHPEYRQVIGTYLQNYPALLHVVDYRQGVCDVGEVARIVDEKTACLVVQHPNFFGCLEPVDRLGQLAKQAGALFVAIFNPISLGVLRPPGDYGADIAVAEGQPLGIPMSFGGPFLGVLVCRQDYLRRMPGRLVGQTVDRNGRRCFVLTLQTREQHIRREKATSNICTNQGLMALRAAIYLAALGGAGLRRLAELCLKKAHYAARQLSTVPGLSLRFRAPFFYEFVLQDAYGKVAERLTALAGDGVFVGPALGKWYPDLADCFLVAVTEKRTKEEIDRLVDLCRKWGAQLGAKTEARTKEALASSR